MANIQQLRNWLALANPGERFVYCTGVRTLDDGPVFTAAQEAFKAGAVHLFVKRNPETGQADHIAQKSSRYASVLAHGRRRKRHEQQSEQHEGQA